MKRTTLASLTIFAPSAEDGYRDLRDSLRKDDGDEHTIMWQKAVTLNNYSIPLHYNNSPLAGGDTGSSPV